MAETASLWRYGVFALPIGAGTVTGSRACGYTRQLLTLAY